MNIEQLKKEIQFDEGKDLKPYRDPTGHITIGIGRNLDNTGISEEECALMFKNDIERVMQSLDRALPWWTTLPDPVARGLCNMTFNLGLGGVLQFKTTLGFLRAHEFEEAAASVMHSLAARQLPNRYGRIAALFKQGANK